MPSAVEIVNLALARICQGAPIASLDEASEPAVQASGVLAFARDDVLFAYAWPFATRRVSLAQVSDAVASPWTYAYRVPSDCVRAIDLPVTQTVGSPCEVGGDATGRLILTDATPATLRYVARVENLSLWPSSAASALAWRIASELAMTIARNATMAEQCAASYRRTLSEAVAFSAGESTAPAEALPSFITAMY